MGRKLALRVCWTDGYDASFSIGPDRPWRVDTITRMLIIGRGVPRMEIPLDGVRLFELEIPSE